MAQRFCRLRMIYCYVCVVTECYQFVLHGKKGNKGTLGEGWGAFVCVCLSVFFGGVTVSKDLALFVKLYIENKLFSVTSVWLSYANWNNEFKTLSLYVALELILKSLKSAWKLYDSIFHKSMHALYINCHLNKVWAKIRGISKIYFSAVTLHLLQWV